MKSYFIDTNYFLRLLLKDNSSQFNSVYGLFQKAIKEEVKIYTSIIVFFEIYWVLSSFYKKNKSASLEILETIVKMNFLDIENRLILKEALDLFKSSNLDLEDCYNIAFYRHHHLDEFASFDKKIAKFLKY